MKPNTSKKARHRNAPAKAAKRTNNEIWERLKAQTLGRKGKFSPETLKQAIGQFKQEKNPWQKHARPAKPSGKKPISRPK